MDPVAALPAEIIAKILSFVNQRDLCSFVQVCNKVLYVRHSYLDINYRTIFFLNCTVLECSYLDFFLQSKQGTELYIFILISFDFVLKTS